ncbi:unnamed protein product, partial [Brenthis ino]
MPKCSLGNCKNITSRTLKSDGISYFRFPRDPIRCKEWISAVRRSRQGVFFKPNRSNVVCSEHFSEKDMYITEKGRVRLLKKAVPLVPTDTQGNSGVTQASCETVTLNLPNIEGYKPTTTSLSISSVLNTPEEALLEMELEKCRRRLKVKNNIISNLRKKNSRLIKRNAVLKSALKILRKKLKLDSNLYQEPTHVIVCEQNG